MDVYGHAFPQTMLLDISLLAVMLVVAFGMLRARHLFAVVMLSGIYSLLSASLFISLDAVDVAFTEAAVGAGVSTVLMLSGMLLTARREKRVTSLVRRRVALVAVLVAGGALLYATPDMPVYGDPLSPASTGTGRLYVENTPEQIDVPNIVTAVLASYRGFDTLGEVVVVFTAGVAVLLLLGAGSVRGGRKVDDIRNRGGHGVSPAE